MHCKPLKDGRDCDSVLIFALEPWLKYRPQASGHCVFQSGSVSSLRPSVPAHRFLVPDCSNDDSQLVFTVFPACLQCPFSTYILPKSRRIEHQCVMDSGLSSPRRITPSVLTGGRPIRKPGSRSSSRGPGIHQSVPLLEFVDNILKFLKLLLRQEDNPLREELSIDSKDALASSDAPMIDTTADQMDDVREADLSAENWSANRAAMKMELDRLLMWRVEVKQRMLTPALKEESPTYSNLCESIMSVGEVLKSRKLQKVHLHSRSSILCLECKLK